MCIQALLSLSVYQFIPIQLGLKNMGAGVSCRISIQTQVYLIFYDDWNEGWEVSLTFYDTNFDFVCYIQYVTAHRKVVAGRSSVSHQMASMF